MKFILLLSSVSCLSFTMMAQGLEGILVEKYYITSSHDTVKSGSQVVPEGMVTYRVFVDMKPDYVLQSVYGDENHTMIIGTSTWFYNHHLFGSYIPNLISDRYITYNTVMLDSWISMGAASQECYGILKSEDDSISTVVNGHIPPLLQHEHPMAGIPVRQRDGLIRVGKPPRVTQLGLDSLLAVLHQSRTGSTGYEFRTNNGAWGCLGGAAGPSDVTNRVLIGQFTTTGDFYFELNIQIGKPDSGETEQYVAGKPLGNERYHESLTQRFKALDGVR